MAKLPFINIRGFKFPFEFTEETINETLDYVAKPDDLFICTYPKCGTTWMQQIVALLFNNGKIEGEDTVEKGLLSRVPFLEMVGTKSLEIERPIAMKTHLPFNLQPWNPETKYIIVLRNPKDACISFYFHMKLIPKYADIFQNYSMQDHIKAFLEGDVPCGSYFDWILSWWTQRDKPNIEFLLYEDMKTKPEESIIKVAKFIGFEEEIKNETLLKDVVENSSLKHMKVTTNSAFKKLVEAKMNTTVEGEFTFIRKGEIGDYKNYFTDRDNEEYNSAMSQKFAGTGLQHLWDEYDIA
ncbi:Sulfotransferase 1E1 [Halotydeus destructor]|nr:Sulfotransferase 1E1 [Halotydeus destructor]